MIYQRIEKTGQSWKELLYPVLLVYNNKLIHNVTKMTPADAMNKSNQLQVRLRLNLELRRTHLRLYPNIRVDDTVKVFKKKDKLDKERVSNWGDKKYKVIEIVKYNNQKFYKLEGYNRMLVRSDLLLVD